MDSRACALLFRTHDLNFGPEVMTSGMDKENPEGLEMAWVMAGCILVGYEDMLLRWNMFKEDLRCSSSDSNSTSSSLSQATYLECSCPGCTVSIVAYLLIFLLITTSVSTGGLIWFIMHRDKQRYITPEVTRDTGLNEETRI